MILNPHDVDYLPLVYAEQGILDAGMLTSTGQWDSAQAKAEIDALAMRGLVEDYGVSYSLTVSGRAYFEELEDAVRAEHDLIGLTDPSDWRCTAETTRGKVREIIEHYGHISPVLYARFVLNARVPADIDADDYQAKLAAYWRGPLHQAKELLWALNLDGTLERVGVQFADGVASNTFGSPWYRLRSGGVPS